MSGSKSNFVLTDDGIDVYVEHQNMSHKAFRLIRKYGIEEGKKDRNTDRTVRWWKNQDRVKKPDLHITKGRFRFVPPVSMCLLGPKTQYDGGWVVTHPACTCDRCREYSKYQYNTSEYQGSRKFWDSVTGRIKIEV